MPPNEKKTTTHNTISTAKYNFLCVEQLKRQTIFLKVTKFNISFCLFCNVVSAWIYSLQAGVWCKMFMVLPRSESCQNALQMHRFVRTLHALGPSTGSRVPNCSFTIALKYFEKTTYCSAKFTASIDLIELSWDRERGNNTFN